MGFSRKRKRFFLLSAIAFIVFALLFSLPPSSRNSDLGPRSRLVGPPPHYGSCLAFLSPEDFSSFFPRRLASNTHARHSQQLIFLSFTKRFRNLTTAGFVLQDQRYCRNVRG